MPNSLDRTWADLLDGLDDNNEGAITEEDIRAIPAHFRPSTAVQAWGGSAEIPFMSWRRLHAPYENVYILPLNVPFATAENTYRHTTGHLSAVSSGFRYNVGSADSGATQPRLFTYQWDITIKSPFDTAWAVSWWVVRDGAGWPSGTEDEWDTEQIYLHHIEWFRSDLGAVIAGENVWHAHASGSKAVTLNPGETLVPALEFLGTYDSTAATPTLTIPRCSIQISSDGPVEGDWDGNPTSGTVAGYEAVNGDPTVREVVAANTTLPARPVPEDDEEEEDTPVVTPAPALTNDNWSSSWGLIVAQRLSVPTESENSQSSAQNINMVDSWTAVTTAKVTFTPPAADRLYRVHLHLPRIVCGVTPGQTDVFQVAIHRSDNNLIYGTRQFMVAPIVGAASSNYRGISVDLTVDSVQFDAEQPVTLQARIWNLNSSSTITIPATPGSRAGSFTVEDVGPAKKRPHVASY